MTYARNQKTQILIKALTEQTKILSASLKDCTKNCTKEVIVAGTNDTSSTITVIKNIGKFLVIAVSGN